MHLPQRRVIEKEVLVLVLELIQVLLAAQMTPLLLGVIHVANKSLQLRGRELLGVDVTLSFGDLVGGKFNALLRHYSE